MSIGVADTQQQLRTALAMGADRAILVQTDQPVEPLTAAQTFLAARKEGKSGFDLPGQAGDRRRCEPNRPDARGDLGPAAGHLRLQGRDFRMPKPSDARGRCRPRDHRSGSAGGHHRRSAVERAALREIAGHHEGEEKAFGRHLARCARRQRGPAHQDRQDRTARRSARRASW